MGRRPLPPHTRAVSVKTVPHPGSQARSQFPFLGYGPEVSVLVKWANIHIKTWWWLTSRAGSQCPLRVTARVSSPAKNGLNLKSVSSRNLTSTGSAVVVLVAELLARQASRAAS